MNNASNISDAEVKVYNADDSQLSNQVDIIIRNDDTTKGKNSELRMKLSELEKEARKLDTIKNRFDETLRKSIKRAKYNY